MTKEELKGTKIWFGDDLQLCKRISEKLNTIGFNKFGGDYGNQRYIVIYNDGDYQYSTGSKELFRGEGKDEITPSQLLGETEEYKAGDWVVITVWQGGSDEGSVVRLIHADKHIATYKNDKGTVLSATIECVRLARPEEIPQEEVEYVECIGNHKLLTIGKIYKVESKKDKWIRVKHDGGLIDGFDFRFIKPSTREAYEAQQDESSTDYECVECIVNTSLTNRVFKAGGYYVPEKKGKEWFTYEGQQYSFKGSTLAFKRLPKNNHVNKCSTINTNQNGKNESCETKIPLDGNTGAKTGQSIRLRTTCVRIKCKSGLLRSGKEVTRTVKSSPRPKAEIGRRFTKGRS